MEHSLLDISLQSSALSFATFCRPRSHTLVSSSNGKYTFARKPIKNTTGEHYHQAANPSIGVGRPKVCDNSGKVLTR
jgi:hypothetical protein